MNTLDKPAIRTTPVELLGHENVNFEFGEIGYYDCPLEITSQQKGSQIHYQVDIQSPPLQHHNFLRFLNIVAPSKKTQYAFDIEGDWEIAQDPESRLHQLHTKLGRPWKELLPHIDPMIRVIQCNAGEGTWNRARNLDYHQNWLDTLPEPVHLDMEWCRRAVGFGTGSLLNGLKAAGIEDANKLLLGIVSHTAGLKGSYYRRSSMRFMFEVITKMQKVDSKPEDFQKITAFTKLPLKYRAIVQGNLLRHITQEDSLVPPYWDGDWNVTHILYPPWNRGYPIFRKVIDRDGNEGIVDVGASFVHDVPRDYRVLDDVQIRTIRHPSGMFEADALVIDLGEMHSNQKPVEREYVDFRTVRQLRGEAVQPTIAWIDICRPDGSFRTEWDLSTHRTEQEIDGIPHTVHRDGLVGLMAVAGYSSNLAEIRDIWKTERELPKNDRDRKQDMGAAQLPLLALMFQRDIARAGFANSVRELVATQ